MAADDHRVGDVCTNREGTMDDQEITISFPGISTADAGQYAEELRQQLNRSLSGQQAAIRRQKDTSMDFGTILTLLLQTGAIVQIASGIAAFLRARPNARVSVTKPDGTCVEFTSKSADAAGIAKELKPLAER
jgi:hypothetical protein